MYGTIRQQTLDRCNWRGGRDGSLTLQYVEAWQHRGDVQANSTNFDTGSLFSEAELKAWLGRTNGPPKQEKAVGNIRLLVCDRAQYVPLDFALSRHAFESIDSAFRLSPLAVSSFESEAGTYSRFLSHAEDDRSKLRSIQMILKVPQKREIFNWGLSLCHEVESTTTTAFLYGTGLNSQGIDTKHDRYKQCGMSPFEMLVQSIKAAIGLWNHPMLLPCLFLSEHLSCINAFSTRGKVLTETFQIEHELGVTKVGQSAYLTKEKVSSLGALQDDSSYHIQRMGNPYIPSVESQRTLSREETEMLTVRINTQSTRVAFTARSPEWNLACAHFILKTLDEIDSYLAPCHQKGQHECRQLLEHNITLAEAVASNIAIIKERMALQLNVLYNFVAQLDNQTSAELAASASRDSTSMKILAFISAFFLPGSFISALFSMNMIDWEKNGEKAVLSDKFWIYWAVTVPLTALTVLGWAAWWYFELGRFNSKIKSIRDRPATNPAVKQGP